VGPRNDVLDGVQIPKGNGQFWRVSGSFKKHWQSAAVFTAKGIMQYAGQREVGSCWPVSY